MLKAAQFFKIETISVGLTFNSFSLSFFLSFPFSSVLYGLLFFGEGEVGRLSLTGQHTSALSCCDDEADLIVTALPLIVLHLDRETRGRD